MWGCVLRWGVSPARPKMGMLQCLPLRVCLADTGGVGVCRTISSSSVTTVSLLSSLPSIPLSLPVLEIAGGRASLSASGSFLPSCMWSPGVKADIS